MLHRLLKRLLLLLFIVLVSCLVYVELQRSMHQIGLEAIKERSSGTGNVQQIINKFKETEVSDINTLKKLMREYEWRDANFFWRAIERKDSYNEELQYYSKDNVTIEKDAVEIISKKEDREDKLYTSGLVESVNAYKYGYFEFVIETPEGKGLFPAIWLMPNDGSALPEIDVFAMIGSEPYTFYGVIHFMENNTQKSDYFKYKASPKTQYTVSLKWETDSLTWYIDNKEIYKSKKYVPDDFMYIIVNQAIGGNWPGEPDDTALPSKFKIDSAHIKPVFKKGRS